MEGTKEFMLCVKMFSNSDIFYIHMKISLWLEDECYERNNFFFA